MKQFIRACSSQISNTLLDLKYLKPKHNSKTMSCDHITQSKFLYYLAHKGTPLGSIPPSQDANIGRSQ